MADRIKGITVEIGGDTTGLSRALSGVNKDIKNTQTQLKDVERLLKLDPSNTELLSQKQKLLKDAIGETKNKLEQLKSVQDPLDSFTTTLNELKLLGADLVETLGPTIGATAPFFPIRRTNENPLREPIWLI